MDKLEEKTKEELAYDAFVASNPTRLQAAYLAAVGETMLLDNATLKDVLTKRIYHFSITQRMTENGIPVDVADWAIHVEAPRKQLNKMFDKSLRKK